MVAGQEWQINSNDLAGEAMHEGIILHRQADGHPICRAIRFIHVFTLYLGYTAARFVQGI
jgi:hypothetical protein